MRTRAFDPLRACARSALLLAAVGCGDAALAPPIVFAERLSAAGLYDDLATKRVVDDALEFAPIHKLWSDGAEKRRFVLLPPGGVIDATDMDHWQVPVGTRFFKEFSLGGRRLETRLILRVDDSGEAERDFRLGAYLWLEDESDAVFVPDGANDVWGTPHDVPSKDTCWRCHIGEPGHVLGFTAVQLDRALLDHLEARAALSRPVPSGIAVPGDARAQAALGWLHANCGHCHNENGNAWPQTPMVLRLAAGEASVETSRIYRTTVGASLNFYHAPGYALRIAPGDPTRSAIVHRDGARGTMDQMPPLATEIVDPDGLAAVSAWIESLPR